MRIREASESRRDVVFKHLEVLNEKEAVVVYSATTEVTLAINLYKKKHISAK